MAVFSAVTAVPSKLKFISAVMPYRNFYPGSAPTLSTNPQDGTLSVTVFMSGVSTNSGKPTWPMVKLERDNVGHRCFVRN